MSRFFHRYQKYLFAIVAILIVSSFAFYGVAQKTTGDREGGLEPAVHPLFVMPEKTPASHLSHMRQWIATGHPQMLTKSDLSTVNFFNDGLMENEILRYNGLVYFIQMDAGRYHDALSEIREKIRLWHTEATERDTLDILQEIWRKESPLLLSHYGELIEHLDSTDAIFAKHLTRVYLAQLKCPPLIIQKRAPALSEKWSTLFHFEDLEQWFGKVFLDDAAAFILAVAGPPKVRAAISPEDAANHLKWRLQQALFFWISPEVLSQQLDQIFHRVCEGLGLSIKEAIEMQRIVEAFHMAMVQNAVASHPLSSDLNKENVITVDRFTPPSFLGYLDVEQWVAFQMYLEAISKGKGPFFDQLPTVDTLEAIAKKCSPLVVKEGSLEWSSVDLREKYHAVPLQEVMEWQISDDGYATICSKLAGLEGSAVSSEQRLEGLEALSDGDKKQVEEITEAHFVGLFLENAFQMLESQEVQHQPVYLHAKGVIGIPDDWVLSDETLQQLLKNPSHPMKLRMGHRVLKIALQSTDPTFHVLSFEKALTLKVFTSKIDEQLEQIYGVLKKKNDPLIASSVEKQGWRSLRPALLDKAYAGRLSELYQKSQSLYPLLRRSQLEQFPAAYQMGLWAAQIREKLAEDSALEPLWAKGLTGEKDPDLLAPHEVASQWRFIRHKESYTCNDLPSGVFEEWKKAPEGSFLTSQIYLLPPSDFYRKCPPPQDELGKDRIARKLQEEKRDLLAHVLLKRRIEQAQK